MRTEAFFCPHNRTHMTDTQPAPAAATKTELPKIRDPRIYCAMPSYGGLIHSPFALSLVKLIQMQDSPIAQVEFLNGDSLVSRARNKLARFFLQGKPAQDQTGAPVLAMYDWLLFIDTDLIFNENEVKRLYDYAVAHGPGVYCGAYPLKTLKPKVVFNPMPGAMIDAEGIIEVREAGTGMMLIHRDVFGIIAEKFSDEIRYEADSGNLSVSREIEHDFFRVGVRHDPILGYKRYLSEDWFFCQLWREAGGKVLMQTRLQCQHIGQLTYPAPMKDIMEAAQAYQAAEKAAHEMHAKMQIEKANAAAMQEEKAKAAAA